VLVVLGSDVLLRLVLGGQAGVDVPTGVVTTVFGAIALVAVARRYRDAGLARRPPSSRRRTMPSRRVVATVVVVAAGAVAGAALLGMLAGDTWVLTGDLVNWVSGRSGRAITFVLDARLPRVVAALL